MVLHIAMYFIGQIWQLTLWYRTMFRCVTKCWVQFPNNVACVAQLQIIFFSLLSFSFTLPFSLVNVCVKIKSCNFYPGV